MLILINWIKNIRHRRRIRKEGYRAYKEGLEFFENPYSVFDNDRPQWSNGWLDGWLENELVNKWK